VKAGAPSTANEIADTDAIDRRVIWYSSLYESGFSRFS